MTRGRAPRAGVRIYRVWGDPTGARDFAGQLAGGGWALVSVRDGGTWVEVETDASDDAVHSAMCRAAWDPRRDGSVMQVLDPSRVPGGCGR